MQDTNFFASQRCNKGCHNARNTTHCVTNNSNFTAVGVENIFKFSIFKYFASTVNVSAKYCKHCFFFGQVQAANGNASCSQIFEQFSTSRHIFRIKFNTELSQIAQACYATCHIVANCNVATQSTSRAFVSNNSTRSFAESRSYNQRNIAAHCNFYCTRMDNFCTIVCHLANFCVGNLLQNGSFFNYARVSSHNAVNVSVDFYKFCVKSCTQSCSSSVTTTTTESSKFMVVFGYALETANNGDDTGFQKVVQIGNIDVFNASCTKLGVGDNACLTTGQRHSVDSVFLQVSCHDAGGNDFATAHHNVHFAYINGNVFFFQNINQSISCVGSAFTTHCRYYNYRRIAIVDGLLNFIFYGEARLFVRYGGAAEFLHYDFHLISLPFNSLLIIKSNHF